MTWLVSLVSKQLEIIEVSLNIILDEEYIRVFCSLFPYFWERVTQGPWICEALGLYLVRAGTIGTSSHAALFCCFIWRNRCPLNILSYRKRTHMKFVLCDSRRKLDEINSYFEKERLYLLTAIRENCTWDRILSFQ